MRVEVVTPKVTSSDRAILLPGSVQPLEETILYARANGFVRRWVAEIGDKVKAGDVLVEIDTPDLDQELEQGKAQLAQAEAAMVQAKANLGLSKTSLDRYQRLFPEGLASQADLDQRHAQFEVDEANVHVAEANVSAQQANIRRLVQLKAFGRVTAPFAGTITQRSVERGALVASGNATPLYKIAAVDTVRVFVQIPQDVAPKVAVDLPAKVTVREFAGRTFDGKVSHAAGALDAASRTMTTVVSVPNTARELLPGMYAQVALTLPAPHRVLEVPATAIISDAKGLRVAVVDAEGTLHLAPVLVERDTGPTLEIATGIAEGARVVKIAGPQLEEGKQVETFTAPPEAPK
jgi:RND family efflux transporter MFP subunit